MSERENLEILINSVADNAGFTSSAAGAKALGSELQTLNMYTTNYGQTLTRQEARYATSQLGSLNLAKAHGEVATAERDVTKEADSMARALGAAGEQGGKALARFESLGATIGSSGALGIGIGAALVGFGAVYEGVKSSVTIAEEAERSQNLLARAYEGAGLDIRNYEGGIRAWLDTNRRFIDDQFAARTAIAELTTAGFSQTEVMRIMNDALDLAAIQGTNLAEAEQKILLGLEGNTRGFRDLGLSTKDLAAAQKSAGTTAEAHAAVLDIIEPKLKDGRNSTTQLKQAQDDLNRSWQDASERYGPALAKALADGIDIANSAGQIIGNLAQHPENATKIAPTVLGISAATPSRDLRTQENLLGNPEIDRRNIDALSAATQRAAEWQDRLGTASMATSIGLQREAEFADAATINLGKQRDESDNLATKNAVLKQTAYDVAVANSEMSTRITEVTGKWRDDADAAIESGKQIRDQLGLTAQGIDTLAQHARDEKVNVTVNVDTGAIDQARWRIDDLVAHAAGEHTINFTPQIGTPGVDWNQ